jgi:hypothetical protein
MFVNLDEIFVFDSHWRIYRSQSYPSVSSLYVQQPNCNMCDKCHFNLSITFYYNSGSVTMIEIGASNSVIWIALNGLYTIVARTATM